MPDSAQEALGALAEGTGATIDRIASGPGRVFLDIAEIPPLWPRDVQARAFRNVLSEVVESLADSRHREVARNQLGLTTERQGRRPAKRLESLLRSGVVGWSKSSTGSEWTDVREPLARMLIERLQQLNVSGDWEQYGEGYVRPEVPDPVQSLEFVSYHMLFKMAGRVGVECTTYRTLRALEDGVDSYPAVAWYYSDPGARVEIVAVANCEVGDLEPLSGGGAEARLVLPHRLVRDERCFFASKVIFHSDRECARIVSHEVRSRSVRELTIGIQFDPSAMPVAVWQYSSGPTVRMNRPGPGSPDFLPVSEFGYVSHTFTECEHGRRYGLQWDWTWPAGSSSPVSADEEKEN